MLRPKDIIDQLGISAPTLRVWSNAFAPVLSPGAQPSKTESGGSAQRRYDEHDLAFFRHAKVLLDSGKTFDETLVLLQTEPLPETVESLPPAEKPTTDVAVIEQTHPVIQAFEEALAAKDETIQTLQGALESKAKEVELVQTAKDQVIASKDETIASLSARIDELKVTPTELPAPVVIEPRFRWAWLNWLLTDRAQEVR